jgi:hypothetical protein
MKQFFKTNWYKLMIGTSAFIFALGFFINSITPAIARSSFDPNETSFKKNNSEGGYEVVVSGGYAYVVTYWTGSSGYMRVHDKVQLK